MTRAIWWKEWREQWPTATALIVVGVGLMASVPLWATVDTDREGALILALILTWTGGLVIGAQLLAGEVEAGTDSWLDALPLSRRDLWVEKSRIGLMLTTASGVAQWAAWRWFGAHPAQSPSLAYGLAFLAFAVSGFLGGLFGSAYGRSTLSAIGWGIVVQVAIVLLGLVAVVGRATDRPSDEFLLRIVASAVSFAVSLLLLIPSERYFTRSDRLRRKAHTVQGFRGPSAVRVMVWLVLRQGRFVLLGIPVAAAALTLVISKSPESWPIWGAVLGLCAGLVVFGPDQFGASHRLFGDRRVPLGTVWTVKLVVPLGHLLVGMALVALSLVARYSLELHNAAVTGRSFDREILQQHYLFTLDGQLLGPLYGFAIGQFCSLVCRKLAVACVLGVLSVGLAVAIWLPSIVLGGLHWWQWIGPPALLFIATRLAMVPWVAGRLATTRPVCGLILTVAMAACGVAGGIAYRFLEVPDVPAFDLAAWERSLPKPEENEGGRLVVRAIDLFRPYQDAVLLGTPKSRENGHAELPPPGEPGGGEQAFRVAAISGDNSTEHPSGELPWHTEMTSALAGQWPKASEAFDRYLDRMASGHWYGTLGEAARLPVGMAFDPRGDPRYHVGVADMCRVLAARSVQLQRRGEFKKALEPIRFAYCVVDNVATFGSSFDHRIGSVAERDILRAYQQWVLSVGSAPDLIRMAESLVSNHERMRAGLEGAAAADHALILRTRLAKGAMVKRPAGDLALIEFVATVPWEAERYRRTLELIAQGHRRLILADAREALTSLRRVSTLHGEPYPWVNWIGPNDGEHNSARANLVSVMRGSPWLFLWPIPPMGISPERAHVRALSDEMIICLALMRFQCDQNRPANTLDEIIPTYLAESPIDPFSGEAYRYRLLRTGIPIGLDVIGESTYVRETRPLEAIIWSVGPDLMDEGGMVQSPGPLGFRIDQSDILTVVPRVKR